MRKFAPPPAPSLFLTPQRAFASPLPLLPCTPASPTVAPGVTVEESGSCPKSSEWSCFDAAEDGSWSAEMQRFRIHFASPGGWAGGVSRGTLLPRL